MANIEFPKDEIVRFCKKHHINKLALFGSALREDFGPDSDVDVLVDFKPGHTPGYFRIFEMERELSRMIGDRKVDLRTPKDLSRYFREKVVATAVVQYAA